MRTNTAWLTIAGTAQDVRSMYEAHPYPSPVAAGGLIEDMANGLYSLFPENELQGLRILDAGCGTGHRLVAAARRYPMAHFTGLDVSGSSLEVAVELAAQHAVRNVEFQQLDLLRAAELDPFDVIVSTGVLHHLEDPGAAHQQLAAALSAHGILMLWHYHALGEHQRMLDREMLLTLWERESGLECGIQALRDLNLSLDTHRYGSTASQGSADVSRVSIDVDAYLHPIVNAYRFEQAIELMRTCSSLRWTAINSINLPATSKLIDLQERETGDLRRFCQSAGDLFETPTLRRRYRELSLLAKLRVLEIRLQPTGFNIIAGADQSTVRLGGRLCGNLITL